MTGGPMTRTRKNGAVYDENYKTYIELYQQLKGIMKERGGR